MKTILVPLTCSTCGTKLKLQMELGELNETIETVDSRAAEHNWKPGAQGWICNRHGETR